MNQDLDKHRRWIANLIAKNNLDSSQSKIQKKHLHLLVRWFPQIDQEGIDSYEKYIKCKNRKATNKSKKNLLECENFSFSIEALKELDSEMPDIYPEHNPPVSKVVEELKKIKGEKVESIISLFNRIEYQVIILTTKESKEIPPKFRKSGFAKERLISIFGENYKNFIATKNDIKKKLEYL
jgi:hypothetical protein